MLQPDACLEQYGAKSYRASEVDNQLTVALKNYGDVPYFDGAVC
jgi:hypothetical protein